MLRSSTLLLVFILATGNARSAPENAPPDLTAVPAPGIDLGGGTYNLGATGMRGWIHTRAASNLDAVQGRYTHASRQILVTHIGPGSPADGVMAVNDVILGVGGKRFTDDARKTLARAIQQAETEAGQGILKLTRWRAGTTGEVQLKLRVMGDYSPTAPFDCPKSRLILGEAVRHLEKEPLTDDLWGAINGLALLSTGRNDLLPRIRELAHLVGPKDLKLELKPGMVTWQWGYKGLFLSEYYLRTRDPEVFPAIQEYTVKLAEGQGMYGTFGHGISDLRPDGGLHGSIAPYGPVNAAGLIGNLAIVMGRKCGVEHPEIAHAIERASKFFGYYVDKGAIPYGEHVPWPYHGSNGKTALSALLFAMQGDRVEETRFFAKMTTASHQNREYGHTGQGFSFLWGALGANTGGPDAAAAYFREVSWRCDLSRRSDGSFTYDGQEQYGPGKTKDDTYFGDSVRYGGGLSPNATYVLTYSIPLRTLHITGRDANPAHRLSREEASIAVACGRFDLDRKKMDTAELLAAFRSWSPIVRGWAAEELASRPDAKTMIPALIRMAQGDDVHAAQGATETLGWLRATEALPALVGLLKHDDHWLRYKAAEALEKLGPEAKPAVADMLRTLVATAKPPEPVVWADPVQFSHGHLAKVLFGGLLRGSIGEVDRDILYPAIRATATNPDGLARGQLRPAFEHLLTAEDVEALAPLLVECIIEPAPANTMFRDDVRMGAFRALTKYHYQEAIGAAVIYAKTQGGHGSENRTEVIMKELVGYGSAARPAIPGLRELIQHLNDEVAKGGFPKELNARRIDAVEAAIRAIETATNQPELRKVRTR